ncbi:hypothetical protein [Bacillus sp. 37MA]|uniref:hypothetical protein n=1 Tax=Bacillus sp. 37MA TaxID=1132442 RepID=UPI00037B4BD5|nr:hypothetical protein [Bacillus sp. 37MA]
MTRSQTILRKDEVRPFFQLWKGIIARSRQVMTVVFIKVYESGDESIEMERKHFSKRSLISKSNPLK